MSPLAAARHALADRLREGVGDAVQVEAYWAERVNAPCVLIAAGSPYLDATDTTFGTWRVRYELTVVAATAPNQDATDALDDLISTVLDIDGLAVASVSAPEMLTSANATYMSARIALTDLHTP